MAICKLYRFQMYDISSDQMQQSKRWGLEEAIQRIRVAFVLTTSAIEVDESEVKWDPEYPGFTVVGWFPPSPQRMR